MSEPLKGVPKSTEETLNPALETVDSAPQHGVLVTPKTFDAGESGVGHWEGEGLKVRFKKA